MKDATRLRTALVAGRKVTAVIQHFCSPWISARNAIWETVLHLGQKQHYSKGNIIIGGSQAKVDHLYYLHDGRVKFYSTNPDGDEKILWFLEKGTIFGEVPFFEKRGMDNIFIAVDRCVVYTFSRQCFNEEILTKHPNLVTNLLESMAYKIRVLSCPVSDLAPLPSRVCKALIYLITRDNSGAPREKVVSARGITQHELACILGVHRVTLNHTLAQLKKQGIIGHISKTRLVINDYPRLLELADG